MKNMVFKNHIINIIVGVILIAFTITAYFMEWYKDFLAIIVGIVLLGLSIKRFISSFKEIVGKYATLLLVLEILLDIVFCGLLFYYQQHIQIYVGLVLYLRGVTYLIVNYITTRKIKLVQYLMNIGYITLGAFLMFTSLDFIQYLDVGLAAFVLLLGAIFLYFGIKVILENKKKKQLFFKKVEERVAPTILVPAEPIEEEVVTEDIDPEEIKPEEIKLEPIKPEPVKPEPVKPEVIKPKANKPTIDYTKLTVSELKIVAKEKGIVNYSSLSKADLIKKINKNKQV